MLQYFTSVTSLLRNNKDLYDHQTVPLTQPLNI
jgi:hypothetical protein